MSEFLLRMEWARWCLASITGLLSTRRIAQEGQAFCPRSHSNLGLTLSESRCGGLCQDPPPISCTPCAPGRGDGSLLTHPDQPGGDHMPRGSGGRALVPIPWGDCPGISLPV